MSSAPRVVVLGAGFGGAAVARTLRRGVGSCPRSVTVIDRSPVHQFTPLFYEVATSFTDHDRLGSSKLIRKGIAVDNATMLARWGADFLQAEITGIDWETRTVRTDKADVPFDHLVVALGAEVAYYGIPGLEENALTMKTLDGADRLRTRLHELLHDLEKGERDSLHIVVGGAGATGIEFATEATMFIRKHLAKGHLSADRFSVTVVEAASRPLMMLHPSLSAYAERRLAAMGIALHLDTAIEDVMDGRVGLCPKDPADGDAPRCRIKGRLAVPADLIVWTGGVRGSGMLGRLGIPTEGRGGRIVVDPAFHVPGLEDVYAIGDAVDLRDPATGSSAPWLAPAAIGMGKLVGKTLGCRLKGKDTDDFRHLFRPYPMVVTLGGRTGVARLGPLRIRGFFAWVLRKAADLEYFLTILPMNEAFRLWLRGLKVFSRND